MMGTSTPRWLVTATITDGAIMHRAFKVTARDPHAVGAEIATGLTATWPGNLTMTVVPHKPKAKRRLRVRTGRGLSKGEITARAAETYAKWLAQRDGVPIEGEPKTLRWDFVRLTREGREVQDLRVRAVTWDRVSILIPNWNFTPAEPVEETDVEAASLGNPPPGNGENQ